MPNQEALTIVAPLDPRRAAAVPPLLEEIRRDPGGNRVVPFGAVRECHFGRVLYLPQTTDLHGRLLPGQLMLLSDCDGPANDHLESLVEVAGDGVDTLFGACADYPLRPASRADRLAFLRRWMIRTKANYVHRPGRTVDQIVRESRLRAAIQEFAGDRGFGEIPAVSARERIVAFVRNAPEWRWALDAPEGVGPLGRTRDALHLASVAFGMTALGPVVLPSALALLLLVRLQELRDASEHIRPSPEHVSELAALEDFAAHNGFTAGGFVKPGLVRQLALQTVLRLIGFGTRHLFTRDSLAGVTTIHFARWIPIDDGRRVVFASNYDGSLESYNNDFIDLVAWGLNLVFSNGFGYPKTDWLLFGGARREQEFKDFLRRHQMPTPAWYSAYPQLTAVQIARNAKLRAGLRGRMNEREAQRWLRLL